MAHATEADTRRPTMPRAARAAIVAVLLVALTVAGVAWWRRTADGDERRRVEHRERVALTWLDDTVAQLADTRSRVATTEELVAATTTERDDLRLLAEGLRGQIEVSRAETSAAGVEAFVAGGRASELARCLRGVEQALNQLAVGDGGALASLRAVAEPCRAAGA